MNVELRDVVQIGPFEHRWPDATERFDHGWEGTAVVDGRPRRFRHGIDRRVAYGRPRVHTVTWLDGEPRVEGVEADDHERSRALLPGSSGRTAPWPARSRRSRPATSGSRS